MTEELNQALDRLVAAFDEDPFSGEEARDRTGLPEAVLAELLDNFVLERVGGGRMRVATAGHG